MAYTSEQYKYLLLRRLQRDFSMPSAADRAYTYNFFVKLFEGVEVTEEAYNAFISALDTELAFCAEHGYYEAYDLGGLSTEDLSALLKPAFALLGIDIVFEVAPMNYYGTVTFTKADETVLVWTCQPDLSSTLSMGTGVNDFRINSKSGREYGYAARCAPYWRMDGEPPVETGLDPHNAGPGLTWSYDEAGTTLTVSGTGSYAGVMPDEQLGCGQYATLILGAGVNRLLPGCFSDGSSSYHKYDNIKTIVLLRPAGEPMRMDEIIGDYTRTLDIYADNEQFRAYAFPSNVTVNWHTLSEWNG